MLIQEKKQKLGIYLVHFKEETMIKNTIQIY